MKPFYENEEEEEEENENDAFFRDALDGYEDGLNEVSVQQGQFYCSFCGEPNDTFIDPSQGAEQEYVEDCQTCCAPNLIRLSWQVDSHNWVMESGEE